MPDPDDDLRQRLARLDPMPSTVPVDPSTSPRAQELLERAMLTTDDTPDTAAPTPLWRKPAVLAAAAVAVVALGIGAVASGGGSTPAKPTTTLSLKAPAAAGGPTMASCIMFSVDILKDMQVAFEGTVTEVGADAVTLDVDRWFKGGTADVVTVATQPGVTSEGGVEFAQGTQYLVTATDGTVNACGYTAEATPDLEASFEQAFTP